MANPNPTHRWTVEQAKEAGRLSAIRKAYLKANPPPQPEPLPTVEPELSNPTLSRYADELAHAQLELLAELRTSESAKDKAALSQAIKNLREAWHMETGQPKPGTIKPERQSSRQQVKPTSEPKLDTTGGSPGA